MRDYSFGNFISALRERRGLSQYQLGALVGVSDKAVSKWENGAATPRIGTIRKLAEILEVSLDELLTCEYATFDKKRKDLFVMKNEIIDIAKNKMKELYGDNPPIRIVNRFKTEEMMLDGQEIILWMGFLGKLQEEFYANDLYFEIRNAQMGASFIAWLLGGTNVNPLSSHYYCPVCGKIEFDLSEKCGIDLPDKKCSCGNNYNKDGFGVDAINMYPFCRWNEIHVSNNGTELTKKCMYEYFKGYGEIREFRVANDEVIDNPSAKKTRITKFGIFSKKMVNKHLDEVIIVSPEEYLRLYDGISVLSVIENVEHQTSIQDLQNIEFTEQILKAYFNYAIENSKFDGHDGNMMNMRKLLSDIENPKFSDLLALYGFVHSTRGWKGNAEVLYDKGIPISELISCREDVYAYLYDKLNAKCCENPSGQVYDIKESVRKGKYSNHRMPAEIEKLLLDCEVPEWYVESMKKILYLFPKTYLIARLKRDICKYIMMNNSL